MLGDTRADPDGAARRERWLRESRLWADEPDDADWQTQRVTESFVEALVAIAQELHASGLVVDLFDEHTPILIHELEYYDEIADQCERANPGGQAALFASWARGES